MISNVPEGYTDGYINLLESRFLIIPSFLVPFSFYAFFCSSADWEWCCREANAKAQRLLRFSQGQESSDIVLQPNGGRVSGKAEHRFSNREARQSSQSPKPGVDGALIDTMETEALGEDFSNTEAIVGTCEDMCSGESLPLVFTSFIQRSCLF